MANYKLVNADQLDSDLTAVGNAIRSKSGTSAKLSFPSGMVSAIGAISTGVELNFDVVGGTSQPANKKKNTIWINTSTPITDWVFSSTQPTAASGRVWISTGKSSPVEFNALKKNGIQVYPLSAKQYVSGAWVDKEAKSYQGGKWVDWLTYLYNNGDECVDITGGWTGSGTKNSNKLYLAGNASSDVSLQTKNKIDFTKISKLHILGGVEDAYNNGVSVFVGVTTNGVSGSIAQVHFGAPPGDKELELDVSNISGEYYVLFYAGRASRCKGYLTEMSYVY